MQQPKGFVRDYYLDRWRHNDKRFISYERGTLSSYGVDPRLPNEAAADALRNAMDSAGHLALLNSAELYFETDEYIVVHAGLSTTPWMVQRKELDTYRQMVANRDYSAAPEQVFDTSDAHNKTHKHSTQAEAFDATDKIVITGHAHSHLNESERVTADGKRVRLASKLAIGMPLYVWQSWDGKVVAI